MENRIRHVRGPVHAQFLKLTASKMKYKIFDKDNNFLFQDCDEDGLITCEDFALIHHNGGYNCKKKIESSEYWINFTKCLRK